MKRIMVFTGTRADFGLLRPVLAAIDEDREMELTLVVGGSHFSPTFGHTADEIAAAGFHIDWKVDVDLSTDTDKHIASATAHTLISVAEAIDASSPDVGLVLGDRYEALAFATACLLSRVPLAHVHGGETTNGAVDDAIRHAITQMATLHFVAAAPFASHVERLGADPSKVFVVGAPGLDTVRTLMAELDDPLPVVEEATGRLDGNGPLFLVSYHPESRSAGDQADAMRTILDVLLSVENSTLLVSAPNADWGRDAISRVIDESHERNARRVRVVKSFGHRAYIAAMMVADVVVGNSSSGVIEAPFTGTPTVNVGGRQDGRPQATSVFQSGTERADVMRSVSEALAFDRSSAIRSDLYGVGDAGGQIARRLLEYCDS